MKVPQETHYCFTVYVKALLFVAMINKVMKYYLIREVMNILTLHYNLAYTTHDTKSNVRFIWCRAYSYYCTHFVWSE